MVRRRDDRPPVLPVALLREVVARESAGLPLRDAAREIGLSPNGLRNFLNGAEPRSATRMKLERWVAARPAHGTRPAVGDLVRLLDALGTDLTPRQLRRLSAELTITLISAYQERHRPAPRWVRELAAHYGAGPTGK